MVGFDLIIVFVTKPWKGLVVILCRANRNQCWSDIEWQKRYQLDIEYIDIILEWFYDRLDSKHPSDLSKEKKLANHIKIIAIKQPTKHNNANFYRLLNCLAANKFWVLKTVRISKN